jgi:bacteriorhodopsin
MITDFVGITFWVATASMLASSVFFFIERGDVIKQWRTSLTVAGLVTGVAFWHYLFMRNIWVDTGMSPTSYRYVDWIITVPLQIVEFYLILKAVTKVKTSLFWQLLLGSMIMLIFGYLGEANYIPDIPSFILGMLGWLIVIYLIFFGEAAKANSNSGNSSSQMAFNAMRWIVLVGWAIYPIGFIIGNLVEISNAAPAMNAIYNLADLVNKTAFGLVIWAAAKQDSKDK